ncbi:MAG: hypothetical protein AB1352_02780 [Patescibacteria group bacterium]
MLRCTPFRAILTGAFTIAVLTVPLVAFAECGTPGNDPYCVKQMADYVGLNTTAPLPQTIGLIIRDILALVGVIFLVLMVYGGFKWMTARGNEEIVTQAKGTIESAGVGLVIVLISYAITAYIIDWLF